MSSFVRFTDALGEDFCQEDLEGYLIEHGVLRDLDLVPSIIGKNENSSDSDWTAKTSEGQEKKKVLPHEEGIC